MNDPILRDIQAAADTLAAANTATLARLQASREARQQLIHPLQDLLHKHGLLLQSIATGERNRSICVARAAELKAMIEPVLGIGDEQGANIWKFYEQHPSLFHASRTIDEIDSWLEKRRAQIPAAVAGIISYAEKNGLTELLPADILAKPAQ